MSFHAASRAISGLRVSWRADRAGAGNTTERWLDKKAHIVRRPVGCFCRILRSQAHIAALRCNVHLTSKALNPRSLFYIAGQHHGR